MARKFMLLLSLCLSTFGASAQSALPQASPRAEVAQRVGVTDLRVVYHRPAVKERTIWGGLVPWDAVWRAGANEATTLQTSHELQVAGQPLPAGTYALFVLPKEEGPWTVIFNRNPKQWGAYRHDPSEDALRVSVAAQKGAMVERMQFVFSDPTDVGVTLELQWAGMTLPIPIVVDTSAHVGAALKASATSWREHVAAAEWLLDSSTRYAQALEHVEASLALSTTWYNVWLKSRALAKLGDRSGARAAAEQAHTLGMKASNYGEADRKAIQDALKAYK